MGDRQRSPSRARRLVLLTLVLLLAAVGGAGYWWSRARHWVSTDDAFVAGNVIALSAQTGGTVIEVLTENTRLVEAGDVLVRLNGARAAIAFEEAKAALGETVRRIAASFSDVEKFRQQIQARKASLQRVQHDLRRFRAGYVEDAVSQQQVQNAEDQVTELEALIRQGEAELKSAEATTAGTTVRDHPSVRRAAAALKRHYLDFVRRNIVAPVRGYVARRKVQVGEQVRPGAPLLAIVPLDQLWVDANFRETELARIRPGQPANITVDLYGGAVTYHGLVEGLQPGTGSVFALLPPENASGNFIHIVERVPVRIRLSPDELKAYPLRPGLSTVTRIDVRPGGRPLDESLAAPDAPSYRTAVYRDELAAAAALVRDIIAANDASSTRSGTLP